MEKMQRIDGKGLESISKLNDSLRFILLPLERVLYCSLVYPVIYGTLGEYMKIMIL